MNDMDNRSMEHRRNPRKEANIFSLLTFCYTLNTFRNGFRRDLNEDDFYEVINSCRSKRCGSKMDHQWKKSRSIYKLLWRRFGRRYITLGLISIMWSQIKSVWQPYGISRLISYFDKNQTNISKTDAYYSAAIVVFLNGFSLVFSHNFHILECNFTVKMLTSLKSLIYRKILRLSPDSLSHTNLGNIITIMTKDIAKIESASWLAMDLLNYTAKTVTVSYLLWSALGYTAFIGLGIVFIALPLQTYLSTFLTRMRLEVGKRSDERLAIMQETLSTIIIIKMYIWEKLFNDKVSESRRKEMIVMMKASYMIIIIRGIGLVISKLTFLILILSYIWMGGVTTTELLFYTLSLFHEIGYSFSVMVPMNICRIAEFRAAFIRLNILLQAKEMEATKEERSDNVMSSSNRKDLVDKSKDDASRSYMRDEVKNKNGYQVLNETAMAFINVQNLTVKSNDKEILRDIYVVLKGAGLTIVTGSVGSGKSCLLKVILEELPIYNGNIVINGTISYAPQEPWLFPSSIKQNILFGERYEATRYEEVIRACALKYDFSHLQNGDETIVLDRGLNLSKGQQIRINLARAMYKNSDIYLLDDSLTSLDVPVQDFIFEEAILKLLRNKICIFVTHNAVHFKKADHMVIMNDGSIISSKKSNIRYMNEIIKFLGTQGDIKMDDEYKFEEICETEALSQRNLQNEVYQEIKKSGKVDIEIYKTYLKFGGGIVMVFSLVLVYIFAQIWECAFDVYITQWIDLQQQVINLEVNHTTNRTYYKESVSRRDTTLALYAISVVLHMTFSLVKNYALLRFCRIASINIHQAMSSGVIAAKMSFFRTHLIGNILNRFSHDLNTIDENIPLDLLALIETVFACIGEIIIITTVNWIFLIPGGVFLLIMILLRMAYIPTGRSLKRLEAAAKSPLVGHINSTLEGLTTIRAFKAQSMVTNEFDRYQDRYSSAQLTYLYTTTAFGFYMDLFSFLFTIVVIARFLFLDHGFSAGNVGLALTQVFILTSGLQWVVTQWATFENDMTSVERTLEYATIKQEDNDGEELKDWPHEGGIIYEKVTLTYGKSKQPILKEIGFSIKPGQKIGIVGRTGAGKSSILSTLFRLYDYDGKIYIDNIDISKIGLTCLRQQIAVIPQDPILFAGTLRNNIDPYKKHSDEVIWNALEQVKVKNLIPRLDMEINEGVSLFSAGQKQLICLARIAIDKYKIVVLDEATANMDSATDTMLHDVVEQLFPESTILMIAHRLHSVLNCDKVMVIDNGRVVEFDDPRVLLGNKNSYFYGMYRR